jgi:DNA-binding transcriptional ArsR family regulator
MSYPSSSPHEAAETPRVLDADGAEDAPCALTSQTARDIVAVVQDRPATASGVADRVDTSVQNAAYHLNRLDEAGVVEVVGTAYSEKGREMDIYAATGDPFVFVAGDEDDRDAVADLLSAFVGGVGLLAVVAVAVQRLTPGGRVPSPTAAGAPVEPLPVGLVVFLVGLLLLVALGLAVRP